MYDILNAIYCSPSCDEQEELSQIQAASIVSHTNGLTNAIASRKAIVSWLQNRGCDIELNGAYQYIINGATYDWSNVTEIKLWMKANKLL